MPTSPFPERWPMATVAIWGCLAACGGDPVGPTDPPSRPANAAEPVVVARPEVLPAVRSRAAVRLEFREEVDGITTRFFPTLERAAASALGVAFKRFEQAVQNDDETDAAAALTDARAALTAENASPADVDALNRAIDAMAAAFDATSDPHSPGEAQ
jgi:hypothetical protein